MEILKASLQTPVRFICAGQFFSCDRWKHHESTSDSFKLIIVLKGDLYLQQEEQKYPLNPGDVLLLKPGIMHTGYEYSHGPVSFYWLHFGIDHEYELTDAAGIGNGIHQTGLNHFATEFQNEMLIPTVFSPSNATAIMTLAKSIVEQKAAQHYTDYYLNYLCSMLLIEISQMYISGCCSAIDHKGTISPIIDWIDSHTGEKISLKDVAYEFNYSREYLSRYFKQEMGVTMQEYINRAKIDSAKTLLRSTDLSTATISQRLGFEDTKYFFRLFKKYEHVTPREYRQEFTKTYR